jgi:hypothetical protein
MPPLSKQVLVWVGTGALAAVLCCTSTALGMKARYSAASGGEILKVKGTTSLPGVETPLAKPRRFTLCDANLSKATLHKQTRSGVKLVQDRPNKRRRFAGARWYATKQETIRICVVSRLEGLAYEAITVPLHPYDRRPARMQLR